MKRFAVVLLLVGCAPSGERLARLRSDMALRCAVREHIRARADSVTMAHYMRDDTASARAFMRVYNDTIDWAENGCDLATRAYNRAMR